MHERASHQPPYTGGNINQQVKTEKVKLLQLVVKDGYVSEEAFGYFQHNWGNTKNQLRLLTTAVKRHLYLASCLGGELSELLYSKFGADGYDMRLWVDGGREGDGGEVQEQVGHAVTAAKDDARTRLTGPNLCGQSENNSQDIWIQNAVFR